MQALQGLCSQVPADLGALPRRRGVLRDHGGRVEGDQGDDDGDEGAVKMLVFLFCSLDEEFRGGKKRTFFFPPSFSP